MNIQSQRQGSVLVVTMDRPEAHNALTQDMSQSLCAIWNSLREDPDLRVAVLTGAGGAAFCAGADLKSLAKIYESMTPAQRRERAEREPGLGGITRNLDPGKPIIAAVGGHCLGGGLELALACDMRIAAEHATFGLPEVRRGIIPGAGGTQRLPRAISEGAAMELLLTGDTIGASDALRLGLVNRVVPATELLKESLILAERIARNAPLAVQAARAAALQGRHLPLEEGLRLEQKCAEPLRSTEDVQEGILAFIEKRQPVFKGR